MKSVKELRKQLNMSLKAFSDYYEIPYNTVRQWENGERTPPIYVIKLLNEVINLKASDEQIGIDLEEKEPNVKKGDSKQKDAQYFLDRINEILGYT